MKVLSVDAVDAIAVEIEERIRLHPSPARRSQLMRMLKEPAIKPIRSASLRLKGLKEIQYFMRTSLQYNYLESTFWTVKKSLPYRELFKIGAEIISLSLPIKCLEAVVVALYLTSNMPCVRIAMSFKSISNEKPYRHIVLALRISDKSGDRWGAIGLSRKVDLQGKPATFKSLSDLVLEFKLSYERNNHTLIKVHIGLPAPHHYWSNESVVWIKLSLRLDRQWSEISRDIDLHARSFQ